MASGSIELITPPEYWITNSGADLPEPRVEIHSNEIGCLSNADTFYRESSVRILIPFEDGWVSRVLGRVRGSAGASDPWDCIRTYLSVSD